MNLSDFILLEQTGKEKRRDFRFSHDTRLYQNCERANGLDEWKLKTIIAMKTFKNSSQF